MRRWWLYIALLLSLGVNVGILATLAVQRYRPPAEPAGRPFAGPAPRLGLLAERLGLEGEERERFVELQGAFLETTIREGRRLQGLRRELRREMTSPAPDRERVERLLGELGATYEALDRALVENILASREILDDEQERRFLHLVGRLRAAARRGGPPGGRPAPRRQPPPPP